MQNSRRMEVDFNATVRNGQFSEKVRCFANFPNTQVQSFV